MREALTAAVAALASVVVAGLRVGAPGSLTSLWGDLDLTTAYAAARTLQTNPWVSPNHDLGFPFGQDLANFPSPDLVHLAVLKALALATGDPAVAVNAFLLLSFAGITVTAYALFRLARIPSTLAATLAFSVSLVPWHFDRFTHAFLANYATVAAGLILVVAVLDWNLSLGGPARARPRTLVLVTALALFVGLTGTYYSVFTSIIAVVALAFQVLLGRRDRSLIGAVWFALAPTAITFVAATAYRLTAIGPGASATARAPEESQFFGGALFTLVRTTDLWSSNWPVPMLQFVPTVASGLEADARNSTVGVVAVVTAFVAAGLILAANAGAAAGPVRTALRYWPWLFLVALLTFVSGGFGQVFAPALGFQIRSWGRMSIVVVMIAYVILGVVATAVARRHRRPALTAAVGAVVVALTLLDVTSMRAPIDLDRARAVADDVRAYGAALDAALPAGCGVLTVPAYLFPEGIAGDGTATYDPLLPYLYSANARWSYGAVRGSRAGDWQYTSVSRDLPTLVQQAKAAGFCAVQVDTQAFADSPVPTLTGLLGAPVASSPSGRWVTFSLAEATTGGWTRDLALDPVTVTFGFGFDAATSIGAVTLAAMSGTDATLVVSNPHADAFTGSLALSTTGPGCTGPVTVSTATDSVDVVDGSARVPVTVPGGSLTAVHVHAPAACSVVNPRVVPID